MNEVEQDKGGGGNKLSHLEMSFILMSQESSKEQFAPQSWSHLEPNGLSFHMTIYVSLLSPNKASFQGKVLLFIYVSSSKKIKL